MTNLFSPIKILFSSVFIFSSLSFCNDVFSKEVPKIKINTTNNKKTKEVEKIKPEKIKIEDITIKSKEEINKVFDIGVKLYESQKYDDSIKVFTKITEKFPGYGDAQYYIGLCNFSLGSYYKSIAYFLEANRIFEGSKMDAMFGASLSYLSSGYVDEARLALEKVIKESKDQELIDDAQNWLSTIDEQSLQKAKVELLTTDIRFREGVEYLDIQNYQKAEESFRASVLDKPNKPLPLYYLGNALYLREKYKEAIQTFEKIIIVDPNSKIAKDSRLYIRVIEDIEASSQYSKPLSFQITTGVIHDSNLSYSDTSEIIMSDMSGIINLGLDYNINNNVRSGYNYYASIFSGINDKIPNLTIQSSDFNIQKHSINVKTNYSFNNNLLTESEISGNWYLLGGNSFLLNGRISPKGYFYLNQNLVTVIQYLLDFNDYSFFKTRNSIDHTLDISQYFYFLEHSLWLKTAYVFKKTNANDQILRESGNLTDGNKYNLDYNFINSFIENNFILNLGFNNLPFNAKLKLEGKIAINNYDSNDLYRVTSPITNIATGNPENKLIKEVQKKRSDLLYSTGFNLSVPIYQNISAGLFYNYTNNTSNIKEDDYSSRSYEKHTSGINFTYDF